MARYRVYLQRPVEDWLRAELDVEAADPKAAEAAALVLFEANPDIVEFRFGECGDQGEVSTYDVRELP